MKQNEYIAKVFESQDKFGNEAYCEVMYYNLLRGCDNVVQMKEAFEKDGIVVIILEYCKMGDLNAFLSDLSKRGEKLSPSDVISWMHQISHGLNEIHNNGILHNDIKTSNIFLDANFRIRIGDFDSALPHSNSFLSTCPPPRSVSQAISISTSAVSPISPLGVMSPPMESCIGMTTTSSPLMISPPGTCYLPQNNCKFNIHLQQNTICCNSDSRKNFVNVFDCCEEDGILIDLNEQEDVINLLDEEQNNTFNKDSDNNNNISNISNSTYNNVSKEKPNPFSALFIVDKSNSSSSSGKCPVSASKFDSPSLCAMSSNNPIFTNNILPSQSNLSGKANNITTQNPISSSPLPPLSIHKRLSTHLLPLPSSSPSPMSPYLPPRVSLPSFRPETDPIASPSVSSPLLTRPSIMRGTVGWVAPEASLPPSPALVDGGGLSLISGCCDCQDISNNNSNNNINNFPSNRTHSNIPNHNRGSTKNDIFVFSPTTPLADFRSTPLRNNPSPLMPLPSHHASLVFDFSSPFFSIPSPFPRVPTDAIGMECHENVTTPQLCTGGSPPCETPWFAPQSGDISSVSSFLAACDHSQHHHRLMQTLHATAGAPHHAISNHAALHSETTLTQSRNISTTHRQVNCMSSDLSDSMTTAMASPTIRGPEDIMLTPSGDVYSLGVIFKVLREAAVGWESKENHAKQPVHDDYLLARSRQQDCAPNMNNMPVMPKIPFPPRHKGDCHEDIFLMEKTPLTNRSPCPSLTKLLVPLAQDSNSDVNLILKQQEDVLGNNNGLIISTNEALSNFRNINNNNINNNFLNIHQQQHQRNSSTIYFDTLTPVRSPLPSDFDDDFPGKDSKVFFNRGNMIAKKKQCNYFHPMHLHHGGSYHKQMMPPLSLNKEHGFACLDSDSSSHQKQTLAINQRLSKEACLFQQTNFRQSRGLTEWESASHSLLKLMTEWDFRLRPSLVECVTFFKDWEEFLHQKYTSSYSQIPVIPQAFGGIIDVVNDLSTQEEKEQEQQQLQRSKALVGITRQSLLADSIIQSSTFFSDQNYDSVIRLNDANRQHLDTPIINSHSSGSNKSTKDAEQEPEFTLQVNKHLQEESSTQKHQILVKKTIPPCFLNDEEEQPQKNGRASSSIIELLQNGSDQNLTSSSVLTSPQFPPFPSSDVSSPATLRTFAAKLKVSAPSSPTLAQRTIGIPSSSQVDIIHFEDVVESLQFNSTARINTTGNNARNCIQEKQQQVQIQFPVPLFAFPCDNLSSSLSCLTPTTKRVSEVIKTEDKVQVPFVMYMRDTSTTHTSFNTGLTTSSSSFSQQYEQQETNKSHQNSFSDCAQEKFFSRK